MNYTRLDVDVGTSTGRSLSVQRLGPGLGPGLGRLVRLVIWTMLNAVLVFAEHLAELFAPLLLLAGGIWWLIPRALDALTLEGQAGDMLALVRARVPHEVYFGGFAYSAVVLMTYAIGLVAVVAVCRTLSTTLAVLLLEQR